MAPLQTTTIQRIRKRNGEIVDFSPGKITVAVSKAFTAVRGGVDRETLGRTTDAVIQELEQAFPNALPGVEDVQDAVERRLMTEGCFDVAKAYIIYRYEHAKIREEKKLETLEKIERKELMVVKRSGEREPLSTEKLTATLARAAEGHEDTVNIGALLQQCQLELHDGIKARDIARTLVYAARAFIEQDPAYSKVAARLLLAGLYKKVIGPDVYDFERLEEQYREAFVQNVKRGVEIGRLDPRLLLFNLDELAGALKPERDDLLMYLGAQVLSDRYLLSNPETKEVLETPQAFWMRIAMGLAILEEKKAERAVEFYEALSTLRFVSSTPTLLHSGMVRPQLSSCFLNTVGDDLTDIFKSFSDNAQLLKWSGGMGTDWTSVRATGALIKGIGVESQGVIPFLKIANDTTISINRSGRRRGAAVVYLETWHYDIENFLELRKNTGDERRRTHDLDTSNWIPDLFMKRVREDGPWTLFSPEEVPELHHCYGTRFEERYAYYEKLAAEGKLKLTKTLKARDLFKKMLSMLYETGHPWITFKDPCNIRSPQDHVGVVHSSNLCTEIVLNTSADETAVCNLGSLNLAKHVKDGRLDEALVKDTVTTAMRMLDNVIDINFYPTPEARTSNLRHRPVGLGLMGFQDALYLCDICFDSEACVTFADESMEMISYYAIRASALLAEERGAYETYAGSKWDRGIFPADTLDLLERERGIKIDVPRAGKMDWAPVRDLVRQHGMRNSNTMAMAPTATISNISGCSPTIEPIYKNLYVKANMSGDFVVINPYLVEDLKNLGLWDYEMLGKIKYRDGSIREITEIPQHIREKYKGVFEIDPRWLIKAAAARGKWIDQSQSLNIFYAGSSGKDLNDIYLYAWELGLKTTYYLRTLAASQVEKATISPTEFGATHVRKQSAATVVPAVSLPVPTTVPATAAVAQAPAAAQPMNHMATPPVIADSSNVRISETLTLASEIARVDGPATPMGFKATPEGHHTQHKELKLCKIDEPDCESCQ